MDGSGSPLTPFSGGTENVLENYSKILETDFMPRDLRFCGYSKLLESNLKNFRVRSRVREELSADGAHGLVDRCAELLAFHSRPRVGGPPQDNFAVARDNVDSPRHGPRR